MPSALTEKSDSVSVENIFKVPGQIATNEIHTTHRYLSAGGVGISGGVELFWKNQLAGDWVGYTQLREYMNLENCSKLVRFFIKQQNSLNIMVSIFRNRKLNLMRNQPEPISTKQLFHYENRT